MLHKHFDVKGNTLSMEVRSEIDETKFKAICDELDQAVAAMGKIRMVIVVRQYPSFNSAEDLYNDLRFLRLYDKALEQVVIVSDRPWDQTWVGLFSLFSGIKMAFFDISQIEEASDWVQKEV